MESGRTTEPASNFGKIMVASAVLLPSASTAVATAIGADLALGRLAGGGVLQQRLNWAIRGAGGPASVLILAMLPTKMSDGTLQTDEQLGLLQEIFTSSGDGTPETVLANMLDNFCELAEHPAGTDLIYWPEDDVNCTPEGLTETQRNSSLSVAPHPANAANPFTQICRVRKPTIARQSGSAG